MKTCVKCKSDKALDDFYTKPSGTPYSHCKPCYMERTRLQKLKLKTKDPERIKRQNKNNSLKTTYGIDLDQYEAMVVMQDGKCAICGTGESRGQGSMHVDHCHETGQIRGLLCHHCNTALGLLNDDPDLLHKASDYILEAKHLSYV